MLLENHSDSLTEVLCFRIVFDELGAIADHLGDLSERIFPCIETGQGIPLEKELIDTSHFFK